MQQGPIALFLVFLFFLRVVFLVGRFKARSDFIWLDTIRRDRCSHRCRLGHLWCAGAEAVDVAGLSIASMPARTLALFGFSVDTVVDCSAIAEATTMN